MIDDTGRSTSDVCVREHLYYYKIFINKLVYVTTVNGPVFACFGFTTGMRWYFCCFASWRPASQHLTTSACSIAPIPSQAAANVVVSTKGYIFRFPSSFSLFLRRGAPSSWTLRRSMGDALRSSSPTGSEVSERSVGGGRIFNRPSSLLKDLAEVVQEQLERESQLRSFATAGAMSSPLASRETAASLDAIAVKAAEQSSALMGELAAVRALLVGPSRCYFYSAFFFRRIRCRCQQCV